jgi:photosystem II stability/assembly factor-like uncharacterized protein
MRTLSSFALAASLVVAVAGCGTTTADPCKGLTGTCVTLTVQSSTVATVDSLHILASGALTGDQTSSGGRANLPIVVALQLPPNVAGSLDLHVDAFLTATLVGSCDTDTLVTPGQHATAVCTLMGVDTGAVDMSMGGDDLTGTGPDMLTIACDPKGVTGPQCQWRWQTPLPTGDQIRGLFAVADTNVFGLTDSGAIIHRDTMGWSMLPNMPTPAIGLMRPLTMSGSTDGLNGTHLYVLGEYSQMTSPPAVFHSTDQGATWTEENVGTLSTGNLPSAVANNGNVAIVVSADGEIITRNAGTGVWTKQQIGSASTTHFNGASVGNIVSLAVGYDSMGGLIASAGSAANAWTQHQALGATNNFQSACGGSDGITSRYWAVGSAGINSGIIYTSTDGTTWTAQTSNANGILYGCVAADLNNVWAWGQKGIIVHTTNGGVGASGWATQTSGVDPNGYLSAGTLSPQGSLTMGGINGTLLRTMNAGATWTPEQTGVEASFQTITAVAPNTLYAAASSGVLARTTDGKTWTKLTSPTTSVLIAAWGSSATDVYVVGTAGTVLHSSDGTTFTKYTNPASGGIPAATTLTDVAGLAANNVFAAGSTGLYRTTDSGATWNAVTITGVTAGTAVGAVFPMGGELWVGAAAGQVYHSTDSGTTWTAQPIPGPIGNQDVTRIRGRAPKILYAAYSGAGIISRSNDGGGTWTTLVPASGSPLGDGVFEVAPTPTGDYLYASGNAGLVVSQDDGVNWAPVNMKVALSQTAGLAVLANNNVYGTNGTGVVHFGN